MDSDLELATRTVPINKIPKHSTEWVMRVLVIRKGSVISYRNSRHEGTYQTIILVDDEGTKLQATLFNRQIDTWREFLKPNKSYYISNGLLDRLNPKYTSVHKEVEHSITENTIIKETNNHVCTDKFSDGFLCLEHAEKLADGAIFDLLCVLLTVNPLIAKGASKRRTIVVTNELKERTTITLWGDLAENDGAFLEKLKDDQPILALCDVRVSLYQGIFGISTIPVSSVLINRVFPKALDLRSCREVIKAEKKEITSTPSKLMKKATEVSLPNLLDGKFADTQEYLYKFTAKIVGILNKDQPWYSSCKKCHKKVEVVQNAANCGHCNLENVEYEMRYRLHLDVCTGEHRARVILFDAAQNLLGCSVEDYIAATSVKKEECPEYRKLVLSKDKQFNFLARIDPKNTNPRRSIIVQEIHAIVDDSPQTIVDSQQSLKLKRKKGKKYFTQGIQGIGIEEAHVVEEVQFLRPRRKRGKKTNEDYLQMQNKKIKIEAQ